MSRRLLVRIALGIAALLAFGWLFMRSLIDARSAPYTVGRAHVGVWSLTLDPQASGNAPLLALRPPPELAPHLFRQIFSRAMESLTAPAESAMPIVLRDEYDRTVRDHLTPEGLRDAAVNAGLEASAPVPRCLVHRRESVPGSSRQGFFAVFDAPAIDAFRRQLGLNATTLSPVLFVAGAGAEYQTWLPLRINPAADCVAPIAITE